jgi:hypothetical protein
VAHELLVGMRRRADDLHATRGLVDHEVSLSDSTTHES